MDFIDTRVPFRIEAGLADGDIRFKTSHVRVHVAASPGEELALQLKAVCGTVPFGLEVAHKYFEIKAGENDGELRTLIVSLKGDLLTDRLKEIFKTRIEHVEKHAADHDAKKTKPHFETTPEEALYFALITRADIQLDVQLTNKAEAPGRVILGLYYNPVQG